MTRVSTRYAAALSEAQEGHKIAERAGAVQLNFGDADDPREVARRCLDLAARYEAAAGHYRAAALAAQNALREPATYETRMGWI